MGGFSEMISIRTKWLDDQIELAVTNEDNPARQLVILGAGYDTRGFRLDLWKNDADKDFTVIEVDQPEVQEQKLAKLLWLTNKDGNGQVIADRMGTAKVQFLTVNFNTDNLKEKLQSHEGFQPNQCTVISLEGVTQYIPKDSTADTLKQLKSIVAPGSTLLITYVDQKCFADPDTLPKAVNMIRSMASKVGEPWISGWTKSEFEEFLKQCGYDVVSDTTQEDYNETLLKSVGRQLDKGDLLNMERFAVAKVQYFEKYSFGL